MRFALPTILIICCVGTSVFAQDQLPPPALGAAIIPVQNPVLPQPKPLPEKIDKAAEPILELVEFRDLLLTDALRLLSQQSGIQVVASEKAGKQKVSLYLKKGT